MAKAPIGMILSAGFGTRLAPLTSIRPKTIMEIAARPIIYHIFKMLEKAGVKDILINLHHHPQQIQTYIEQCRLASRVHPIVEKEILGTAGGLANAIRNFHIEDREMIIMHGDILCDIALAPFLDSGQFCTLICDKDREVQGYVGSVGIDARKNIIELGRFYKKGAPAVERGFFTGIHVLSKEAVSMVGNSDRNSLVGEVYPSWLRLGHQLTGIIVPMIYEDLGSVERLWEANMSILRNWNRFKEIDFLTGFVLLSGRDDILVGEDVTIHESARLTGPLMIASGARIERNVELGPCVMVGEHSRLNEYAAVKNSVIMSQTNIEKDERMDCVIALGSVRVLVKAHR